MASEFARVGLEHELWPAVDSLALTGKDRDFVDLERRRRLGLYAIPDGSLANTLSQRAAMRDLVENGPNMMAVFEDDARFDPALPEVLAALEERSDLFDIVKLQRRNFRRAFIRTVPLTSEHWLGRVRFADFGSEGYVITRDAARRLLVRNPHADWSGRLNVFYDQDGTCLPNRAERSAHRRLRSWACQPPSA